MMLFSSQVGRLLVSGGNPPSKESAISRLAPVALTGVIGDRSADPKKLDKPLGMGSRRAGIAVLAVSGTDVVNTRTGDRRAPIGSRLLAFRVGDWTCEAKPCQSWESLDPQVSVDGEEQSLPEGGDTFVVVMPPGTTSVTLGIDADGFAQAVPLFTEQGEDDSSVAARNIGLLAKKGQTRRMPLTATFQVSENTSIALRDATSGQVVDLFTRSYAVNYAQRRFFLNGTNPGSPGKAFLIVNAFYSYPGQTQKYVALAGSTFVDGQGRRYQARDLDPDPAIGLVGFVIPADVRGGTFEVGGATSQVASNGVAYTSTLGQHGLRLDFS